MAIGDPYATLLELKNKLKITDTVDDLELEVALTTTSRNIEHHCRRQFNKTTTASARVFDLHRRAYKVHVADFHTTTGLVVKVDPAGDESFTETLASSVYRLEPRDGIVDGEEGWPWSRIVATQRLHPLHPLLLYCGYGHPLVQVTAQWGWAAVPAPVKTACLILASELFKIKDAPFGVAGYGEYGPIRVRQNPIACGLLQPYRRNPVLVG